MYYISLQPGKVYHVYNRGINGISLFPEEKNYSFFLKKYALYLSHYVDTFAYCLLGNHFHFLIRVKEFSDATSCQKTLCHSKGLHHTDSIISKQFACLFSSYTQSINKVYGRTGGLFENPFKRKEITTDTYFSQMILYIHQNPQKHGFVDDFTTYPHSSYHSHLLQKTTRLQRAEVISWFGNAETYISFHQQPIDYQKISTCIIEVD